MKGTHYYILYIAVFLLLASCSSSRKAIMGDKAGGAAWKSGECVVAKANIGFADSKGKGTAIGGTLRMKRDDVVQLNATYVLGIQVGTLEITKDSVLIISRATRQYATFDYSELSSLLGRKISFEDFQDIFWGDGRNLRFNGFEWSYGAFAKLEDDRKLPAEMELKFASNVSSVKISLAFSNHKYDDDWSVRTKFNASGYANLSIEQVVQIIALLIGK